MACRAAAASGVTSLLGLRFLQGGSGASEAEAEASGEGAEEDKAWSVTREDDRTWPEFWGGGGWRTPPSPPPPPAAPLQEEEEERGLRSMEVSPQKTVFSVKVSLL